MGKVTGSNEAVLLNSSTETKRDSLKSLVNDYSYKTLQSSIDWGQYLAGLFEGDGYFNGGHGITITFHSRDLEYATKLAALFGHGYVNPIPGKDAVNWVITDTVGVVKFLTLIEGNLRTQHKIDQINIASGRFIPHFTFSQSTPNTNPIIDGWWLSGFSDADACFIIQVPSARNQVRLLYKFNNSIKDYAILRHTTSVISSVWLSGIHP